MGEAKPEILSFDDAIKSTGIGACTLLLGNGFSIAQGGGHFGYNSLFENCDLSDDNPIRNVFAVLGTFDFEKVMRALHDAAQIELAYGDKIKCKTFMDDAAAVREALIHAVRAVHPGTVRYSKAATRRLRKILRALPCRFFTKL